MKSLLVHITLSMLVIGPAACGGESKRANSSTRATAGTTISHISSARQTFLGDGDADNPGDVDGDGHPDGEEDDDSRTAESYNYHDKDDESILRFGHAAGAPDRQAIISLVKRYYTSAAAGDGSTACSLLPKNVAESVPGDYGQASGPTYLRGGKTCQAVMSMLFKHFHNELIGAIEITAVRVKDTQAEALIGSKTMPASDITARYQGGAWRIEELLGSPLP